MFKQSLRLITAAAIGTMLCTSNTGMAQDAQLILGGKQGIGLTAPTQPFEVHGIIYSNTGGFKFPDGTVQTTALSSSQWTTSGSNIYYLTGNVGIGTSSPTQALEVNGTIFSNTGGFKFPNGTIQTTASPITIGTGTSIINNLGGGNSSSAALSFIGSGKNNVINGNADYAVILGGQNNVIENQSLNYSSSTPAPVNPGSHNFISSGEYNRIKPNANHAAIIGGRNNTIATGAANAIVLGGSGITATEPNTVYMQKVAVTDLAGTGERVMVVDQNGNLKVASQDFLMESAPCKNCPSLPHFSLTCGNYNPDTWHYNTCDIVTMNNVGIGTYSPNNKLSVAGGAAIGSHYADGTITPPIYEDGLIVEGKVGIGTVNPSSAKLEVQGNGTISEMVASFNQPVTGHPNNLRRIFFTPNTNGYNWITKPNDAGIYWTDGLRSDAKNSASGFVIAPWADAASGIRITHDGNVGIGTATIPTDVKLAVCGTIQSKEIIIDASWCDYVFDKNYNRMTWQEKLAYIKMNKHLPAIAPGKEIETNGLKAGETMQGMVQNIEENTLDVIDLYQIIKKQNEEIIALKKAVEQLKEKK